MVKLYISGMGEDNAKMKIGDQYLIQCKYNYFAGITPANIEKSNSGEYNALVTIGKKCIEEYGLIDFSGFFRESQYFIALWTAHIIFEHGKPSHDLKVQCIEIIKKYSNNPLSSDVSKEEQEWLEKNANF